MKKTLLVFATTVALITSLFYLASCGTEDLCATVDCGPHGNCNAVTGTCDCDAGYKKDTNGRCDLLIDPCSAVDCGANATCTDGVCNCVTGYEKDAAGKCTITWADKFEGSYSCKDVCTDSKGKTNTYLYETTAKKVANSLNKVEISNFAGFNLTSSPITINDANKMVIDFTDASGRIFKGTADFIKAADATKKDEIKMTYTITFTDKTVDSCVVTYTRK